MAADPVAKVTFFALGLVLGGVITLLASHSTRRPDVSGVTSPPQAPAAEERPTARGHRPDPRERIRVQVPEQAPTAAPAPATDHRNDVQIVEIDSRVTEDNSSWARHAWKLTLHNSTDRPISVHATIKFLDADGFLVDEDTEYSLVVPPMQDETFTGSKLITHPGADRVARTRAEIGWR